MVVPISAALPDQLAAIRAQVNDRGSAIVASADLQALCPDELSVPDQFLRVAEIASEEEWDFEFIGDRIVRFSSTVAARRTTLI